jgi:hypothetical protein
MLSANPKNKNYNLFLFFLFYQTLMNKNQNLISSFGEKKKDMIQSQKSLLKIIDRVTEITQVLNELYFLYLILFFYKGKFSDPVLEFLFDKVPVEKIREIIAKYRIFQSFSESKPIEKGVPKLEMIKTFMDITNLECNMTNTFLQDIFNIAYLFKKKYTSNSLDIYITSFYYLMQCTFDKNTSELSIRSSIQNSFSFPFDIDVKEWTRPIFIVDVQNALRYREKIKIRGTEYDTSSFRSRKKIIVNERKYILEKLFAKHNLPGTLVLFISQGDMKNKNNCISITNLRNKETSHLLQSDKTALFIEVPCAQFAFHVNNYFIPGISVVDNTTGRSRSRNILKYCFDRENTLYYFDKEKLQYRLVNNVKVNKELEWMQHEMQKQQAKNKIHPKYGSMNQENVIPYHHQCLIKNELDDYMIGFILLLIQKAKRECYNFIVQYKPIVFTNDHYDWMKASIKKSCTFEKDFFGYLLQKEKHEVIEVSPKAYSFWYNGKRFDKTEKYRIQEISHQLQDNLLSRK